MPGPTAFEIKESYEAEKAELLTRTFDLAKEAGGADVPLNSAVKKQLSEKELRSLKSAAVAEKAQEIRDGLKAEYEEKDLEMRAALEARAEQIREELRPKSSFIELAQAAQLPNDALKTAFGVADEEGQKVALSIALERDDQELLHWITGQREDFEELVAELAIVEDEPSMPSDEAFEVLAEAAPDKSTVQLSGPISDINQTARLR